MSDFKQTLVFENDQNKEVASGKLTIEPSDVTGPNQIDMGKYDSSSSFSNDSDVFESKVKGVWQISHVCGDIYLLALNPRFYKHWNKKKEEPDFTKIGYNDDNAPSAIRLKFKSLQGDFIKSHFFNGNNTKWEDISVSCKN